MLKRLSFLCESVAPCRIDWGSLGDASPHSDPAHVDPWISGICADSKQVKPGDLFIARKGGSFDGAAFAKEAMQAGARAIATETYLPECSAIPQLILTDMAFVEGKLAAHYYEHPDRELFLIGVTGTNGKTTVSWILYQLLSLLVGKTGWIGTIEYRIGDAVIPATRTTPGAAENQQLLRKMRQSGCSSAVMEVTSHALDQGRVYHIEFDMCLFTNLTPDHLDYHRSMEHYCKAKNRLFLQLNDCQKSTPKWAVVNRDCPWHSQVLQGCTAPRLTYGLNPESDLSATDLSFTTTHTHCKLSFQKKPPIPITFPLLGKYNLYNVLGAIACLLAKGFTLEQLHPLLHTITPPKGRLEPVYNTKNLSIFVDFAHTGDGLKQVLSTLRELCQGRLIVVFGCGGDRDRNRRSEMGQAASSLADYAILTADNPRSEDPVAICQEISLAFSSSNYTIEPDRRQAIELALRMAKPQDLVLIAGKGHEKVQIQGKETRPFDDVLVATQICQTLP